MKNGFVRVAAASPKLRLADCEYNTEQIISMIRSAEKEQVKLLVFPELCITGYTCADLFLQELLLENAKKALERIASETAGMDILVFVGLPLTVQGVLYNTAAAVQNGTVLGFVPKRNIPNYSEFYEARQFHAGQDKISRILWRDSEVPFGGNLLFCSEELPELCVGAELCEDLWTAQPPSGGLAEAGALLIVNLSASDELTGKAAYRRELVKNQSARLILAYLYADAGEGESTTDMVFAGHNLIAENGTLLAEKKPFEAERMIMTEIDLGRLAAERRRITTWRTLPDCYETIRFFFPNINCREKLPELTLTRKIDTAPFVPDVPGERKQRCEEIISIQAAGLVRRLSHIGCSCAVLGISGGLDSTLALLVTRRAFDILGLSPEGILAVTMPCFGTTDRTYSNAVSLVKELGATLREIRINEAVELHFRDIGHDKENRNVVYENAQARERTQILMDIANSCGGIVVGTGDLSELALGWATYNGDHMSMYGVNASIPKTLVRYLVADFAEETESKALRRVLLDVLDTPVSPELLPPKDGDIAQKTEELVGPYELHDFFLYYIMRFGFCPKKIFHLAGAAFAGRFEEEIILHWLKAFYRRFFSQQYKRSCLPDGPKVGSVALSPRGDLRMPSDAVSAAWLKELEEISCRE